MQETTCNAGDLGLIPGLGRSYGEGKGNSLKYSCLKNSMDRGTWWATVQRVIRVGHYLTIKQTQYLIPCLTYFFAYLVIIPLFLVTHFQFFSAIGWPNASGICPLLSQGVHCDQPKPINVILFLFLEKFKGRCSGIGSLTKKKKRIFKTNM